MSGQIAGNRDTAAVRAWWFNGNPVVMVNSLNIPDVSEFEEAVVNLVNAVVAEADAHPETITEAEQIPDPSGHLSAVGGR